MVESTQDGMGVGSGQQSEETVSFTKYDRRSLSYASTFEDPWKASVIRVIEAVTQVSGASNSVATHGEPGLDHAVGDVALLRREGREMSEPANAGGVLDVVRERQVEHQIRLEQMESST